MKAFPSKQYMKVPDQEMITEVHHSGMDLRDYFAAKAMQSFCWHTSPVPMESIAIRAYEMADAMMKAREDK